MFAIEDEFRITAENTIPPFKTLGDIADYVARVVADRDTKPRVADKLAEGAAIPSKAAATAATLKGPQAAKKANGKANGGANGAKLVKGARAARPAQAEPSQDAPRKPKRAGGSRVGARAR